MTEDEYGEPTKVARTLLNGNFAKFSLVIRTMGALGTFAIACLVVLISQGYVHVPVRAQVDTPIVQPVMDTHLAEAVHKSTDATAAMVENQRLILQLLEQMQAQQNETAKTTLRQSIILDNVVRLLERLQDMMAQQQRTRAGD